MKFMMIIAFYCTLNIFEKDWIRLYKTK